MAMFGGGQSCAVGDAMASLQSKISEALNEARILMLGAQILLGFQFHAIFQNRFEHIPGYAKGLDSAAFALMIVAVGLLLAPAPFHRLVEGGDDTPSMHRFTTLTSIWALPPFALCIAIDVFIAADRALGIVAGALIGGALGLLAMILWYGIEVMLPTPSSSRRDRAAGLSPDPAPPTSITERIKTLGIELRVILPGAQALLGFQFAAVLTGSFEALPDFAKRVHLGSLVLLALAIILLMAPAPYHRLAAGGEDRPDVDTFGSWMLLSSLVPLAMGLSGDFYLVLGKVVGWSGWAVAGSLVALAFLLGVWFAYPLLLRGRGLLRRRTTER